MLNVTSETKLAYKSASAKTLTIYFPALDITFDNDYIVQESFSLEEILEADEYLTFIGCNSSKATFSLRGVTSDFKNQEVEISIQAGETESIPLFHGFIDEQTIKNYRNSICEFVAYDILYTVSNVDVAEWYINYFETYDNTTIKDFRDALFEHLEIDVVAADLVNDDVSFTKQYSPVQLSALTLIKYICQINGVFGIINRDGDFEYRELSNLETADDSVDYYKNLDYQRYTVSPITKVTVRQSDLVEGVSVGTGTNTYILQGNFFTLNLEDEDLEPIATNLLSIVSGKSYIPFTADIEGYPWIEVGDVLQYRVYDTATSTYSNINFYLLSRKLTGIHALFDNQVAEGDKDRSIFISSIQAQIDTIRDQIESIQGKLDNIELKYQQFYNERDIDIGDSQTKPVTSVKFGVAKDGQIHFEMEYLIEVETTEEVIDDYLTNSDLVLTVLYEYDGLIIDSREPKDTYQDGKHILSCYYVINVDSSLIHTWKVYLNCVGGSIHIDPYKAQNTLLGLNLLGQIAWDGLLEIEEELEPVDISATHPTINVSDLGVIISKITPTRKVISETLNAVNIESGIVIATDTDSVVINQVVKYAFVDESKQDEMTYDDDYVIIDNHNFILNLLPTMESTAVTIDSGYCSKVTPAIDDMASIESVVITNETD